MKVNYLCLSNTLWCSDDNKSYTQ